MKRLVLCIIVIMTTWVNSFGQSIHPNKSLMLSPKDSIVVDYLSSFQRQLRGPMYELYPTTNMWNFLKLNTGSGAITVVQFSIEREKRFEYDLDSSVKIYPSDEHICGRFKLVPTQNRNTFLLLDQIDGRVWQVQWSLNEDECLAIRIY